MFRNFNRRQKLTVFVFAIANFSSAICVSLQAPFYPQEAEKKGATPSQYGFVFGIFELTVFIVSPVFGNYLSRLGAKRVFNAGIFTTGVCSVLFGLLDRLECKNTFIALSFVTRSIEAIGNSGFLTASFAIIAQEFPERVATMFASMETCFGLGLIVGPTVGGGLYEVGGYTLPFVVMGSTLIAAACLTFFVLPSQYNQRSHDDRSEKGLLATLKVPAILLAAVSIFCASVSLGFLQATLEPHMRRFNLAPFVMGAMFVVNGGTYAVSAPAWGFLCDKALNPKLVTAIGSALIGVSFLFLGPVPFIPFETNLIVCITSLVVHGVGFAAVLVSGFALAHREAVKHGFPDNLSTYAMISSLWTSTFALGAFVGPSVAGVLFDHFGFGWSSLLVVLFEVVVVIVSAIFIGVVTYRKKERATKEETEPLLSSDECDRTSQRPSYESLIFESSSTLSNAATNEDTRVKISRVPRSRPIFSPFVSPIEGVSMMSMMGCSMAAASQTNSIMNPDEMIVIESDGNQGPPRRGEVARRVSRRHGSSQNHATSGPAHKFDEATRRQMTELIQRIEASDENLIG